MFNSLTAATTAMEFDLELFESGSDSFAAFEGNHADTNNTDVCMDEGKVAGNNISLAKKMEEDKRDVLGDAFAVAVGGDMTWLESTSDYQSFVDLSANLSEVKNEPEDEDIDTDALINDVESFLQTYEASAGKKGQVNTIMPDTASADSSLIDGSKDFPLANSTFTEEETDAAEKILDSLLQGEIDVDPDFLDSIAKEAEAMQEKEAAKSAEAATVKQEAVEKQILGDSGYFDLSNVSQIVTEDGRNIIIMVAPPSPSADTEATTDSGISTVLKDELGTIANSSTDNSYFNVSSPAMSTMSEAVSEVSEISKSTKGRPTVKRNLVSKTRKVPYAIKDKKERKKLQNVEAARRYRDKKKAEMSDIEVEEAALAARNKVLSSEVGELESEIRTMKKLMVELGILKK